MSAGPVQVFYGSVASGASTSAAIDLGVKSYNKMAVYAVTMSTQTVYSIYGSPDDTVAYAPVAERAATASVQYQAVSFPTSTSGMWVQVNHAPPLRFVKFVMTGVVSGGVSFIVAVND